MKIDDSEGKDEDDLLWHYVTRDVVPLDPDKERVLPPVKKAVSKQISGKSVEKSRVKPEGGSGADPGLDRRTSARSRRGKIEIDGRLDLHGHGIDKAREVLEEFLVRAYRDGRRQILVITGKGTHSRRNDESWWEPSSRVILKDAVPEWLSQPPLQDIVLQFAKARQKDGGAGALYVLLRRKRGDRD